MALFSAFLKNSSKEIDILRHDVGVFKNLINERQHPLDLIRELLSNAAAAEVGASRIEIGYTKDKQGHVFEVSDNGCGMDFTGDPARPGRLDRFLGLGMSGIVGAASDEFSWKGLGSKLAYQSRKVMIETRAQGHPLYEVRIDEPWTTVQNNEVPRPRITEHSDGHFPTGTRIRVLGHPPHRHDEPFTREEIRRFLLHRTFAGFTRPRANPPKVMLSVLGHIEQLDFGFPELRGVDLPEWLELDAERKMLLVNTSLMRPPSMSIRLTGFLTWDPAAAGLSDDELNTGLTLSSRGIPYFELPLTAFGAQRLATKPGRPRLCLVADCDQIYSEMNLSRSGLVDSGLTTAFREALTELLGHLEASDEYGAFRTLKAEGRREAIAASIAEDRRSITADDQKWVVLQRNGSPPVVLMREPKNDTEAVAILSKLESLGALPFGTFQTVAHPDGSRSASFFVQFSEDPVIDARSSLAMFEAGSKFTSYRHKSNAPDQQPNVICWDVPGLGRRSRLKKTAKKYKFTVNAGEHPVPVYVMKLMDGLDVLTTRELRDRGIRI